MNSSEAVFPPNPTLQRKCSFSHFNGGPGVQLWRVWKHLQTYLAPEVEPVASIHRLCVFLFLVACWLSEKVNKSNPLPTPPQKASLVLKLHSLHLVLTHRKINIYPYFKWCNIFFIYISQKYGIISNDAILYISYHVYLMYTYAHFIKNLMK